MALNKAAGSTSIKDQETGLRAAVEEFQGKNRLLVETTANSQYTDPLPTFTILERRVLAPLTAYYKEQLLSVDLALKEFHMGGSVACEGAIASYVAATTQQVPGGGFNSALDVAMWTNTGAGSSAGIAWVYNITQSTEGSGSASHTFVQSDNNNYPQITYTWSSPIDLSAFKSVVARARPTVAAGGAQTRTLSVRLQSGTAIRIWQLAGTTTTAPFSTEQWHTISGDIESPHATAGTGTFDINRVDSISLRLQDGGNKTGTIYWDDIEFLGAITVIDKIYAAAGSTNQLIFDPVKSFTSGETLMLIIKNTNTTLTGEVQGAASGVDLS